MATYDLYNTDTGALIRSQSFASPPPNPAGKPWAWKVQASLSPSGSQEIVWDETTKARVLVPKDLDARKATMTTAINAERSRASAIPKSASFTSPFVETSTFEGVTSPWTTPSACRCRSPAAASSSASHTAFLVVTHDMALAQQMDRILRLEDGKLVAA